jgi:hypothetical protein
MIKRLLLTLLLVCLFCATALAGPPEMPGYEGQQVTDSEGVVWVWYNEMWRWLND